MVKISKDFQTKEIEDLTFNQLVRLNSKGGLKKNVRYLSPMSRQTSKHYHTPSSIKDGPPLFFDVMEHCRVVA